MRIIGLSIGIVIVTRLAWAQVPDHLECYKVKDSASKVTYTADLNGLTAEPGCVIKVPAIMFCVQTGKMNLAPSAPGGGPSPTPAGRFVCYKLKCAKPVFASVPVNDQFGSRTLQPKVAKMLCAPEGAAVSTTTNTTTTTSGTTVTPTSTSTTTTSSISPTPTTVVHTGVLSCSCEGGAQFSCIAAGTFCEPDETARCTTLCSERGAGALLEVVSCFHTPCTFCEEIPDPCPLP
jgi:hypothetical protein